MTDKDIQAIVTKSGFPHNPGHPELIETHISWVLIGLDRVYKIKKPVHYSFLDFSTLQKRRYYCEREVALNRRLTQDIYLGVVPVTLNDGRLSIDGDDGVIIDYAVCMRKMDPARRMDIMLANDGASDADILRLADRLALFHEQSVIFSEVQGPDMQQLFNDIRSQEEILEMNTPGSLARIEKAIACSDVFLAYHANLMTARRLAGYYRDGHGDLHTRNIFLLDEPQVFDCIEFNDAFRRIDILNDVAFLCMDLDASGHRLMSELFFDRWAARTCPSLGKPERALFIYYKAYRANIRAKVNGLRAGSAKTELECLAALQASDGYLRLMEDYFRHI